MMFKLKKKLKGEYARVTPGTIVKINNKIYEITGIEDKGYQGNTVIGFDIDDGDEKIIELFNLSGLNYYIDNGTIKFMDNAEVLPF